MQMHRNINPKEENLECKSRKSVIPSVSSTESQNIEAMIKPDNILKKRAVTHREMRGKKKRF